jgi:hypothetical protein
VLDARALVVVDAVLRRRVGAAARLGETMRHSVTVVTDCILYERSEDRLAEILSAAKPAAIARISLCADIWDAPHASAAAERITARPLVLVGARACRAFRVPYRPFKMIATDLGRDQGGSILVLPHPSGRCREWNHPTAVQRARQALRRLT